MDGSDLAPEDLERASTAIHYISSLRLPSTSSGLQGLSGGALFLAALAVAILLSGVDLVSCRCDCIQITFLGRGSSVSLSAGESSSRFQGLSGSA